MKKTFFFILVFLGIILYSQTDSTAVSITNLKSENNGMDILWAALAGCIIQEIIYWFELRYEIAKGNIPDALNSKPYWIITTLSIIIFSTVTYFYFEKFDNGSDNFFTISTFAAGFPRLFKSAVSKIQIPPPSKGTGINPSNNIKIKKKFGLKEYFRP